MTPIAFSDRSAALQARIAAACQALQPGQSAEAFYGAAHLGLLNDEALLAYLDHVAADQSDAERSVAGADRSPDPASPPSPGRDAAPTGANPTADAVAARGPEAAHGGSEGAGPQTPVRATPLPISEADQFQVRSLRWLQINAGCKEDKVFARRRYQEILFRLWRKHVAATGQCYYPKLSQDMIEHFELISDPGRN